MRRAKAFRSDFAVDKGEGVGTAEARAATRLKNINLTKLHASYERYIRTVPRDLRLPALRQSWHPVTPDHRSRSSISQWNREIGAWRRRVYLWSNVTDSQCGQLSEAVSKGDVDAFLSICERPPAPDAPATYAQLVDPDCTDIGSAPVLYKPSWFKGQLTHAGFQTVEESDFVARAGKVHDSCANPEFREFYADYIKSYTDSDPPVGGD
ncbi:50S ribosomal protein [Babesia ovata]|uniref:50S ribosomal protein n=1 Tax=Babesia ovata TaxID=189622 RepID=A0A2H6KF95_9APIC|nr:50S ribosomal protein [Babesia ovata]GBE61673.1 50S ribosomal protein [Babesia ovata]